MSVHFTMQRLIILTKKVNAIDLKDLQSCSYQYSSPLSHKTAKSTFWNMPAVWNIATSVHIWLNTSINFQNAKWVQNSTTNECKGESKKIPKHHFNMQHIPYLWMYFRSLKATMYVTEVFPGCSLNLPLTQHSLTHFICQSSQIQS